MPLNLIYSKTARIPTMIRTLLITGLFPLLALLPRIAAAEALYYNIAHAINHSKYIDWAVQNGANGIEADLRFTDAGYPFMFQHGTTCECQFPQLGSLLWNQTGICIQMMKNDPVYQPDPLSARIETVRSSADACNVNESARSFMNTLASKPIALFIVDSKVGATVAKNDAARLAAGQAVIALLRSELFEKGYQGKVIVGVDKSAYRQYIEGAVQAARGTPYFDRIYFSFDEDGNSSGFPPFSSPDAERTLKLLKETAPGRAVYGNGISANFFGNFRKSFQLGVNAEKAGDIHMNYIWTLDKPSAMETYLDIGVRGVMTNDPAKFRQAIQPYLNRGGRMALPSDPL